MDATAGHPTGADIVAAVSGSLRVAFGPDRGRGSVSFLGAEPIEVLRFGPDDEGLVRYATLGVCRQPMTGSTGLPADPLRGPRVELVLSLRGRQDGVLRSLAALASAPMVEGLVLTPDATVDTGQPLWPGAACTAVLLGAPVLPEVLLAGIDPVRLLPVVPITRTELAYRRIHGAAGLREAWAESGIDVTALSRLSTVGGAL